MQKILRVDMSNCTGAYEEVPPEYEAFGGRGLIAKILLDEVKPDCHPLGKYNKLIFAPGLLGGTVVPSSGRISIGAKSPLTGGIKESNGGGLTASKLARLGIKAVIVEGKPGDDSLFILKISQKGWELIPADDYRGMGNYQLVGELTKRFGSKIGVASIGPAGENLMAAAGIANMDIDGNPSRFCGRGGLGAVMGSKGLKALVVDDSGTRNIQAEDPKKLQETLREYIQIIKASPVIEAYKKYGTSGMVATANALGFLPTRNFHHGRFVGADRIDGEFMYNLIRQRGGKGLTTHNCMPGCIIGCSNVFPDSNGEMVVSPLEYETIGLFGANCYIDDLDTIARINYLCNDIGLDTIEVAVALGIAMEAGVVPFGDKEGALKLIKEIGQPTLLGRVLGAGAVTTGRVLGIINVPAVKGQAMAAYDPRSVKGVGVTYAVSPMGADHTAGTTARAQVNHLDPKGQVELSRRVQLTVTIYDCLGLCMFVSVAMGPHPKVLANLLNARYGWDWDAERLLELSKETIRMERRFNQLAGFSPVHDRLPEFFAEDPCPETGSVFDVPQEEIDQCYNF
ncbi:aldehyde ferredoxin oxidoreductase family protein [Desulfofundulus thermocisternus]|uniref:aldehyde ferredoxin oxidoreductase family protein n=1 Tax=Desulfofundulus thermocisternus TaxID=42471 RepID=UPI00217DD611|nr:aldehyde ferredoxin oxidoreductase C-terminal domain-containing protein [Desulfofundulus thermocisternus]MCS5695921.1 aldehyde ferredoxin oxidoreductase [Desulfofundulus thermocisternus]